MNKFKRLLLLTTIAIFSFTLIACSSEKVWEGTFCTITTPDDWKEFEFNGIDGFVSDLSVGSDDRTYILDISYTDKDSFSSSELSAAALVDEAKHDPSLINVNIIDSADTSINGYPCTYIAYTDKASNGDVMAAQQYYFQHDDKIFFVSFACHTSDYLVSKEVTSEIINTISFK